jgi:hypothetical protein
VKLSGRETPSRSGRSSHVEVIFAGQETRVRAERDTLFNERQRRHGSAGSGRVRERLDGGSCCDETARKESAHSGRSTASESSQRIAATARARQRQRDQPPRTQRPKGRSAEHTATTHRRDGGRVGADGKIVVLVRLQKETETRNDTKQGLSAPSGGEEMLAEERGRGARCGVVNAAANYAESRPGARQGQKEGPQAGMMRNAQSGGVTRHLDHLLEDGPHLVRRVELLPVRRDFLRETQAGVGRGATPTETRANLKLTTMLLQCECSCTQRMCCTQTQHIMRENDEPRA